MALKHQKWLVIILAIVGFLVIYLLVPARSNRGLDLTLADSSDVHYPNSPVTITYWRTWDGTAVFDQILADYKKLHPNVTVNLVNLDFDSYDQKLAEAASTGQLPDIFTVRNDWLARYKTASTPAPTSVFTLADYKKIFAPLAIRDLITDNQISGLTYALPTLGLFYNPQLLAASGITSPPTSWEEVASDAPKLTHKNGNTIAQSGIALGTASILHSTDILSLLMMQNGATMTDQPPTQATFAQADSKNYYPGAAAVEFYTSFASPTKQVFSWDDSLGYDVAAFAKGKVALMINYPFKALEVNQINPSLNYKTASLPQIKGAVPINYSEYWVELVNKKSPQAEISWDLLRFIASKQELAKFTKPALRPASRLDLAHNQESDSALGPFAKQVPSAADWYRGDNYAIDKIFANLMSKVLTGQSSVDATAAAAAQTTAVVSKKP